PLQYAEWSKARLRRAGFPSGVPMTDGRWRALDGCDGLPGAVEDWLAEPGSLTARIRARCGEDFRFRVIDERLEQGSVFAGAAPGRVLVREISMGTSVRPLVFARTR